MINIFKKNCNSGELNLFIRELELPEKEYEGFRLKLNDGDWINIENKLSENFETSSILFKSLDVSKRHTAYGQVKLNDEWIELQSATFAVQSDNRNIPYVSRPKGTGIKSQLEEPIIITNKNSNFTSVEKETILVEETNELGDL